MSKKAIELAGKHDGMWATIGLHPNVAIYDSGFKIYEYEKLFQAPKVIAIGEVGLDYYRTPEPEKQKTQRKILQQFLELASRIDKPLIFHCRNAHQDLIAILKSYFVNHKSKNNIRGVIHSFTGDLKEAEQYIEFGFCLGFNGIITFVPRSASRAGIPATTGGLGTRQYDEIVEYIPFDRILLETDAPYLTPEPYRGQRNEPAYIIEVAKKIAQLRGDSIDEVILKTKENAEKLFRIPLD